MHAVASHCISLTVRRCSNIIEMRSRHKDAFLKQHGIKLGFMSPFVKAACYALQDQPVVNAGESAVWLGRKCWSGGKSNGS